MISRGGRGSRFESFGLSQWVNRRALNYQSRGDPDVPMKRRDERGQLAGIEKNAIGSNFKVRFYPWIIESASGVTLRDADGSEYLDFSAGAAAVSTGHCHPAVVKAVREQAAILAGSAAHMFPTTPSLQLAERLVAMTPGRYEKK